MSTETVLVALDLSIAEECADELCFEALFFLNLWIATGFSCLSKGFCLHQLLCIFPFSLTGPLQIQSSTSYFPHSTFYPLGRSYFLLPGSSKVKCPTKRFLLRHHSAFSQLVTLTCFRLLTSLLLLFACLPILLQARGSNQSFTAFH